MLSVAINPIARVPFNVTEPLHFRLPLTLHKSEHVWIQRDGNFCNFKVVCGRRLWPLTNGISIKVCVSEASDPRSDRGGMCFSGGGLHYLFAARAFIQKPFHSIEQSGSCKSTWQDFRCLIFKNGQSKARICMLMKTAEKTPLTILIWQHLWGYFYVFFVLVTGIFSQFFFTIITKIGKKCNNISQHCNTFYLIMATCTLIHFREFFFFLFLGGYKIWMWSRVK